MVTRAGAAAQQQLQKQIFVRGETAYQCSVCARRVRVPANKYGLDIIQRCIITKNCLGKLHKITTIKEANSVSAVPESLPGITDWTQRRIFYQHEQPVETEVWAVEHNLASKPIVQVFVEQPDGDETILVEVEPLEIRIIDLNNLEIVFATPQKGNAQCVALSSVNTINPNATAPAVTVSQTMLLTNNGELTIATLNPAGLINFTVTYKTPNVAGGFWNVDYVGVDNAPSVNSPWVGANKVFIGGKTYTVRSFNLIEQETAPAVFGEHLIADGSQFFFSSFSTLPGQNLILLGTPPFTSVDRIVDRYVDIGVINQDQPEIAYAAGEAFATASVIRFAYPPVLVV